MPLDDDVLPGILPIGISLFAGASGVGKTSLIATLAKSLHGNLPIFGHQPNPVPFVGVLTTDRSWDSHKQWFTAAGFPDIPHHSYHDDGKLVLDRFTLRAELPGLFIDGLKKLDPPNGPPPGSVVFVDTVSMFIDGNMSDYKRTAISLIHLSRICNDRNICAIGVAHMAKQRNDPNDRYLRPQDRILGSAALLGFTDTQMFLLAPEETGEDSHLFGWCPHHSAPEFFPLERDKTTGLFVPVKLKGGGKREVRLQELAAFIQPLPAGSANVDIVEHAIVSMGLSRTEAYRLIQELGKRGVVGPGPEKNMVHRIHPA